MDSSNSYYLIYIAESEDTKDMTMIKAFSNSN